MKIILIIVCFLLFTAIKLDLNAEISFVLFCLLIILGIISVVNNAENFDKKFLGGQNEKKK